MLAGVPVLQDDIEDLQVVDDIVGGAIGTRDRCVLTKGECAEDRGDGGGVEGDPVEHGTVGAIIHGIKDDLELDGEICGRHRFDHDGNKVLVVSVGVGVNGTPVSQWGRVAVGDRGGRVYGYRFSTHMEPGNRATHWAEG